MFQTPEVKKPSDLFGGPRGLIDSGVPPVVFVIVNVTRGLTAAVWAAVAAGAVLLVARLVRKEQVRHAVSGFLGIGIAAGIAKLTGKAKNFFLPGILINVFYGALCLVTAFTKYPVVGVIVRQLSDKPESWHDHPTVARAYREATFGWAGLFLLRVIVQEPLRRADLLGPLAAAKLAMGYPLYIAALLLTLPYINRRTRGVVVADDPHPDEAALPDSPFEEVHHDDDATASTSAD